MKKEEIVKKIMFSLLNDENTLKMGTELIDKFALEYHNEQLRLLSVVKSVKEKKLPKIEDYVTDYFYKLKGNQYLKKEDCTSWTIEQIIEDYHRQIALQL